jgi:Flp pilus assembly protein TadG
MRVRFSGERGATLVEAAFVVPLVLLLTFGVWTVARAWQVHNTIDHAVREAARFGATVDPWDPSTSPAAVRAVLDAELQAGSIPTASVLNVCPITKGSSPDPSCGSPTIPNAPAGTENVFVRVRWSNYPLNFLFWTTNVNLTGTAVSRWES